MGKAKADMRFWITQKAGTVDAVIKAIESGECTTEHDVETIAKRLNDRVEWANQVEENELEM